MAISMYQASVPTFIHAFANLAAILKKGAAYAEEKKFEPSVLINARLAPDMFALSRQVQIATDVVKGGIARLAGVEIPSFPDNEATFDELQQRLEKTVSFLKTIQASQIDGSQAREINIKAGPNELKFNGQDYLLKFVIPNLYFHVTAAYAILRHNGVDVGKMDFLGDIQ
jgi:hypothetical protein